MDDRELMDKIRKSMEDTPVAGVPETGEHTENARRAERK